MSGELRSNGSCVQPRQNVGTPPSRFWRPINHVTPRSAACTASRAARALSGAAPAAGASAASASNAPAVSSASGTPPGRSVHAQPPGAAPVYGCSRSSCKRKYRSSRFAASLGSSPSSPAPSGRASAATASDVTQLARSVSIGQLPSARADAARNAAPRAATGWSARSIPASDIVTKAVRGVASRKPPFSGWSVSSRASVRPRAASRANQASGFSLPPRTWTSWPIAISAGSA